jgi:hypothetical protein
MDSVLIKSSEPKTLADEVERGLKQVLLGLRKTVV